jgi:C4-dicarboxylate transporter DctM subunit
VLRLAACSGSSIASAITIGNVAYPNLAARGLDMRFILGSISAGGTLGILIPPSIIMIIYGTMAEQSVGRLFMAGLIPGILLAFSFMAYIAIRNTWLKKGLAVPLPLERVSLKERLLALLGLWQVFLLAIAIMGGIYGGIATPTEVASVGAVMAILFAAGARRLTLDTMWRSLTTTVRTTGTLLIIFTGAKILGAAIAYYDVPIILRDFIVEANLSPFALLALLLGFYIIMGPLFDGLSMMIVTLPFVLPLLVAANVDLIWFGILLVLVVEVGLLTPPVGMNLYVLQSATRQPLGLITRGAVPFLIPMFIILGLITAFPDIARWLPRSMID